MYLLFLDRSCLKYGKNHDTQEKGWTMLEEACDDCNVPLMRNREGEVICFSCNAHFIKNQDGLYNV